MSERLTREQRNFSRTPSLFILISRFKFAHSFLNPSHSLWITPIFPTLRKPKRQNSSKVEGSRYNDSHVLTFSTLTRKIQGSGADMGIRNFSRSRFSLLLFQLDRLANLRFYLTHSLCLSLHPVLSLVHSPFFLYLLRQNFSTLKVFIYRER